MTNCLPLPTTKEVGYAFIITREFRPNAYLMDNTHQRYKLIHYYCFIHSKPQALKGTPKVKAYSLQVAWFSNIHNCTVHPHWLLPCLWLYQHIGLVLYQKSDIHKHSLFSKPQTWGLLQVCCCSGRKAPWGIFWVIMTGLTDHHDLSVIGWLSYEKFLWHLRSYWPEGCQVTP